MCNIFIAGNRLLAFRYDPLASRGLVLDNVLNGVLWNMTVTYPINKIMNKIYINHLIHSCNNGEYVSLTLVNDQVIDCKSGGDETNVSCFIHGEITNGSLCKTSCFRSNCTCNALYYQSIAGGCLPYSSKCGNLCVINGLQNYTTFLYTQISFNYEEDMDKHESLLMRKNNFQRILSSLIKSDCTSEELKCNDESMPCFVTECKDDNELQCKYGCKRCFPFHKLCVYELDDNGNLMYCYSGSHLKWCRHVYCNNMFKCYEYYCIPYR